LGDERVSARLGGRVRMGRAVGIALAVKPERDRIKKRNR